MPPKESMSFASFMPSQVVFCGMSLPLTSYGGMLKFTAMPSQVVFCGMSLPLTSYGGMLKFTALNPLVNSENGMIMTSVE
jgi:hypothetical protein